MAFRPSLPPFGRSEGRVLRLAALPLPRFRRFWLGFWFGLSLKPLPRFRRFRLGFRLGLWFGFSLRRFLL